MMAPVMGRRRPAIAAVLVAAAAGAAACGSQGISSQTFSQPQNVQHGAQLFAERCSGCHTFGVVGTQGTTDNVRQRERTDGPNFDTRKETPDNVLYAIRNGGFSGAIMPENIVVGRDAVDVAAFLSKYAGK
jgi:mono/diheme cytochrome c family protein